MSEELRISSSWNVHFSKPPEIAPNRRTFLTNWKLIQSRVHIIKVPDGSLCVSCWDTDETTI